MNATNAYNRLNANVAGLKKASEKLSSGYRINRAGDDAAGLAISEKMRSQIKGLNQATRNAQDGINMIQTFEGAAQETHSILQRMKELATESANGTYDNPTDRAAIQLEFDQLNDELNQIADTDFNGTIVLNGGEMADGLKAVDGEFDYANAPAVEKASDIVVVNRGGNDAAGANLENVDYDKDAADALWKTLGLDPKDVKDVNITFVKNGDNWNAVAVHTGTASKAATEGTPANPGTTVAAKVESSNATLTAPTIADATKLPTTTTTWTYDDGTGAYTGWSSDGGATLLGNAAAWQALGLSGAPTGTPVKGDTITFTPETTTGASAAVPGTDAVAGSEKNITTDELLKKLTTTAPDNAGTDATGKGGFKLTLGDGHDVNAVFNAYEAKDGDYITLHFTNTADKTVAPDNIGVAESSLAVKLDGTTASTDVTAVPEGAIKIEMDDSVVNDDTLKNDKELQDALAALKDVKILIKGDGTIDDTNSTMDAGNKLSLTATGELQYTTAGGTATTIATITVDADKITGLDNWDTTNSVAEFGLKAAQYHVATDTTVKAESIETSDAMKNAFEKVDVTKANAFTNSTARMTYTDNITLQTGARTKDAVNFTFKYNTDGSADMGNLKANLNLSSRADGLATANLSLANQKDANYAIDQIDKAINKTSMVRATFGSIQNRLEHKITNLTTTSENLTEAESSIRDTDMASEMMNYTKFNILQQAAQSMLAQANQQPQSVLQLLG